MPREAGKRVCVVCGVEVLGREEIVSLTYKGIKILICKGCFSVHVDDSLFQMTFEVWEKGLIAKAP